MFQLTGPMGQQFTREMKKHKESFQEYKGLTGVHAKKAFRDQWLNKKLEDAKCRVIKSQKFTILDEKNGVYISFKRVWDLEGSDMDGYQVPWGRK